MNHIRFVIVLDSCCISKTLSCVYIKDRPVSSLGVFVFEFLGASFSSVSFPIGASFSRFRGRMEKPESGTGTGAGNGTGTGTGT